MVGEGGGEGRGGGGGGGGGGEGGGSIRIISDKNGTYGVEISSFYSGKKIYVSNKNEDISIIFLSQVFSV